MSFAAVKKRLAISTWSLVPFVAACVLLSAVLYSSTKGKPLTGRASTDVLLWLSATIIFFGSAFGLMFVPLPGVKAKAGTQ
jgi:hypothetical protein